MEGKTFTFGSKGSTSGRLMPEYYIRKHLGKSPDDAFRRVGFSGDHSRTIALVQSGSYQVGAVNFKVWENEIKAGAGVGDKVGDEKLVFIALGDGPGALYRPPGAHSGQASEPGPLSLRRIKCGSPVYPRKILRSGGHRL